MAEPALTAGELLRALDATLAPARLVCFAGRWRSGMPLIGWGPSDGGRQVRLIDESGSAHTIGCAHWAERSPDGGWTASDQESAALIEGLSIAEPVPFGLSVDRATSRDGHLAAVEHAIGAIRAGDIYQVNVCARLHGRIDGPPLELFIAGIEELAPDHAAFVRTPERTVVSLSPELFLQRKGDLVRTAPIKGTRPRSADPAELLHSRKDRAENVMIVDLMRNDLSRVCVPGSVAADRLLQVRPAPGVWHLVSEVTGRVPPGLSTDELLTATFPPGSVTGAPKLRAIEIYQSLETESRGLFTGAVGLIEDDNAEFNVAIRTFEFAGDQFALGVGGGITADSIPMLEWQECQLKAAPLLALGQAQWTDPPEREPVDRSKGIFDTMLAVDGRVVGLADHLARLEASVLEVYGRRLPASLGAELTGTAGSGRHHRRRIRVTVGPDGAATVETGPAPERGGTVSLTRGRRPEGSWRHKWTSREWAVDTGTYFTDETGGLAETSTGNLVHVPERGTVRTPVLSSAVLPGVTRRRFLDAALDHGWRIELGRLGLDDVRRAGGVLLSLSSLRELVVVDRIDGVRLDVDDRLAGELRGWL